MTDINHSIRLHQAADFPADEPETRYAWRGTALYLMAIGGAIAIGCAVWVWVG